MSNWPADLINGLACIGALVCALTVAFVIYGIFLWLKDQIIFYCKRYKDKHFANKVQKPKCCCIQCEFWPTSKPSRDAALCTIWDKWTSANETCSRGRLRSKEGYKNEEWRIKVKTQEEEWRIKE